MRRSPLIILFFTVFIDLLGFGIILPLLPYYAESYGASPFEVGLLATSYSLMQFVFMPLWGRLSDRHGRRPLILLSLAGSCIGYLVFGLARELTFLFVGRIIAGIAGAIIPATQAYIADVTPPEERARGMGMIGAALGLGFILGPALGGLLSPYGYDKPALLASGLAGANFLFGCFRLPESLPAQLRQPRFRNPWNLGSLRASFAKPHVGLLLSVFFIVTFAFSNMEATFGLLNEHVYGLTARQTGYLFTYIGVLIALAQGVLAGRMVRWFGERICISLGILSMALGLALMPYAPGMPGYCAIIALLAFGTGVNNPSINGLLSRSTAVEDQGGIMGIAQSMGSLGRVLGPVWGGFTFGSVGTAWPFLTGALFMTVAFVLSLRNFRYATPNE